MTFALRGLVVTFSVAVTIYVGLSILVVGTWRDVWRFAKRYSAANCADLLFGLRVAPMVAAVGVTAAFVVPSFLWLEPRKLAEPVGGLPLALAVCGVAAVIVGVRNSLQALGKASRMVARWASAAVVAGSEPMGGNSVAVMRSAAAPPLTATGILKPAVWLSRSAESVLTQAELHSALRHEIVHLQRRDNLRKLILRLVAFPGMKALEGAWIDAAEMAADDAAVSNASEALDLAGAVIKLSQLAPLGTPGELTTALVHSPIESVDARVQRLVAWDELHEVAARKSSSRYSFVLLAASSAVLFLSYGHILFAMHAATELLMR
jgi:beta-lactamase regulating signal transducer with metallopeptidase domain